MTKAVALLALFGAVCEAQDGDTLSLCLSLSLSLSQASH